ncbi:MAG: hypothetical protein ACO3O9_06265, partial [Candidatus Nanopelagicales bacterium]
LELWREDKSNAEIIFEGLDFTKGELLYMVQKEDVVKPDDLLRRRTPLRLLRTKEEIEENKLIQEVLETLKS